ncbi:carbohydrate ABC transporter membrane protein 2, CUT1 family [Jatrophihabitans endophyticus]|uniref:Carbohydrate ABC transporter membrane protein 2, CUT1 family n=1 Tax=Jatrophihabitans endophyticus TaxID=1206085 RepID=A0A1M5HKE9_9ACTN|nr:carbohydrate ABC transporter permease [Jatrophihabitans endophyticus]SHG16407.1 carbohydrate ABC transporter membrane protein 2, CUT1 family [Jatrophihabitans endophyticus]
MTLTVEDVADNADAAPNRPTAEHHEPAHRPQWWRYLLLGAGALVFVFPFYYMLVGSFADHTDGSLKGLIPGAQGFTFANYTDINRAIALGRSLLNSLIFTAGVLVCTLVFGTMAGYALARLRFRGRGVLFALLLLVQAIPFQLLIIPMYVLVARDYGLSDSYLGMIAPYAINSVAVFVFRQYFLQLPEELFEAARIDGATEWRILWSIAIPMVRPALLTGALLTFIGPWNEFLWPFLVTKKQTMQPLAVSLSNYITATSAAADNPFGTILAGACVLAVPVLVLFVVFQRWFVNTGIGSGVKG